MDAHIPVLLDKAIAALQIQPNGTYVDLTVGRAGHSSAILRRLTDGKLYAFDQDHDALDASAQTLAAISDHFVLIDSNFSEIQRELAKRGVSAVDGILMDLGVSSPQFDEGDRGFSYRHDGPLDMRMDADNPLTAAVVVNTYDLRTLTHVLRDYGDERFAYPIAQAILRERAKAPILTTGALVEIIKSVLPKPVLLKKGHPAKQTFQALRIEVNHELDVLTKALSEAAPLLKSGGRLVVITFHSGEDRIVKNQFRSLASVEGSRHGPGIPQAEPAYRLPEGGHVILPDEEEIARNHRAQSAKMRILEKK